MFSNSTIRIMSVRRTGARVILTSTCALFPLYEAQNHVEEY